MKMIAFSPYGYWQSRRNRMDMFVTILGVAWIILDHLFYNTITLTLGKFMIKGMKIEKKFYFIKKTAEFQNHVLFEKANLLL